MNGGVHRYNLWRILRGVRRVVSGRTLLVKEVKVDHIVCMKMEIWKLDHLIILNK